MADELKQQSQLARIVVPAITDVEYAKGLADAFNKINDNFKKIASLPFLQGVQGDSYQLEEYPIWEKDTTENWILTEEGKILLDSIFGIDTTKDGTSFDAIRTCIGEELNGVSPIDFFMTEEDTIVNNSLYFYVIKDDTGNIIEKQLGQYYYFVDGRIKEIGNIYNSENSGSVLSVFNDYTGFYQYKYDTVNLKDEYIKIEILPTIYYDQNKNDICWKFNGYETGISAIGVKGADGKDAELSIVQVDLNNENGIYNNSSASGRVVGILSTSANNGESAQWITDPAYFKTGKALIYMSGKIPVENSEEGAEEGTVNPLSGETETNEITINDFAYGEIIKQNDEYIAYWEPNCVFSKVITNNAFTQYFYNMGTVSYTNNAPYFLAIPSIQNRDSSTEEAKKHAHIIKGYDGDKDSNIESLNIFHSDNAFDEVGNQQINAVESSSDKILNIKNYDVNISKTLTAKGKITGTADLEISGAADLGGSLTVGDGATITGDATIKGCATITGGPPSTENGNTGLTLSGQRSIKIGGVGLETSGGVGTQGGGTGLVVHGGSGGVTGKSIEAHGDVTIDGNMNVVGGVEIYSGTGATTDENYLKVNSTAVTIGGSVGKLDVYGDIICGGSFSVESHQSSFGGDIYMEDGGNLTAHLDNVDSIKVVSKEIVSTDSFTAYNVDSQGGGYRLTVDDNGLSFVEQLSDDPEDSKNLLSVNKTNNKDNIQIGEDGTPIDTIYLNAKSVSTQEDCDIDISQGEISCGGISCYGATIAGSVTIENAATIEGGATISGKPLKLPDSALTFPNMIGIGDNYYTDTGFLLIPHAGGTDNATSIRYSADKYPSGSIAFISPGHDKRSICVWYGPNNTDYDAFDDDYHVYMLIFTGETYTYDNKTWAKPSFYVPIANRKACKGSTYSGISGL